MIQVFLEKMYNFDYLIKNSNKHLETAHLLHAFS